MSTVPSKLAGGNLGIKREELRGGGAVLVSFLFRYGANVYAFGNRTNGSIRYTLVDAGDARYRDEMPAILREGGVDPASIERIIITHRHPDHCGLAHTLARASGARITAHEAFRGFVEGTDSTVPSRFMRDFDPALMQECEMEYLSRGGGTFGIDGVEFPVLSGPERLGDIGALRLVAPPESRPTHSPDQMMVLWTPGEPTIAGRSPEGFMPTDNFLCSGDLWLMRGPLFDRDLGSLAHHVRHGLRHIGAAMKGGGMPWGDPRDQDAVAKEALKKGFCLVKVKPGHGNDFLGTRLIPYGILADRDLVLALGYSLATDTAILKTPGLLSRVEELKEQAYVSFTREVGYWLELGYSTDDAAALLVRIYREQRGGGGLVEQDRRQRRQRLQATLERILVDPRQPDELKSIATATLPKLMGIS